MQQTDEYLLEMALSGDGGSFGQLVTRWEKRIYGFIRRQIGNPEDARDLTQDTFAKAFQHLPRLTDPSRFPSWLYTIALNECRMRFRRLKNVIPVALEGSPAAERSSADSLSPERVASGREAVQRLERAFRSLPPEQREVIIMKEYEALRFQDIAEILGIPLSTAKSRLYLGLRTLRRLLEEQP